MSKQERRKSLTSSAKRRRSSERKRSSHSSISVVVATSSEDTTLGDRYAISEKKISYQDELVFIFFNSMMDTVVEDWSACVQENSEQSLNDERLESSMTTKDFKELKSEDLIGSQVCSVVGSQVSFAKKKKRRRSSTRSKSSSKRDSRGSAKESRKDNVSQESKSRTPKDRTKRRSSERKQRSSLKKANKEISTTQLSDNSIYADDRLSAESPDLSTALSHEFPSWILKSEDEYVRITFKNGNVYEGPITKKMMHGKGKFFWADGSVYEGEFENGFITGRGFLTLPDLSYYSGEFCKGMFHGEGIFCMANTPMIYCGQWKGGKKHGKGWLLYEPGNWYDGEWFEDKRHGIGLRQYKSGAVYKGYWCCGYKKGQGSMRWKNNDFYKGEWLNDLMHGYGEYTWNSFLNKTFTFPLENIYMGAWLRGMRDGMGLMHFGVEGGSKMAGIWQQNLKHGAGVMVCGNGQVLERNPLFLCDKPVHIKSPSTSMDYSSYDNKNNSVSKAEDKSSLRMIAHKVSTKTASKKLDQKTVSNINKKQLQRQNSSRKQLKQPDNATRSSPECNPLEIPIHAVAEQMDLTFFINKCLKKYKTYLVSHCGSFVFSKDYQESSAGNKTIESSKWNIYTSFSCIPSACIKTINESTVDYDSQDDVTGEFTVFLQQQLEEKCLRNTFTVYLPKLYKLYNQYATLAADETVKFKTLMTRLFLWQLWRDLEIWKKGLSLIDVDLILIENPNNGLETEHDPFEKICFWQFIQALLDMAWYLYADEQDVEQVLKEGILSSIFKKFLDELVFPNAGNNIGHSLFEFKNMIPIRSAYSLYCSIGEPHTAKTFLQNTSVKKKQQPPCYLKTNDNETKIYPEGINVVPVGSNIIFLPVDPPDVGEKPKTPKESESRDSYYKNLMVFRSLGSKRIIQCLQTICPNIKSNGVIVNMEYKLCFLEFYETIILCAFAMADKVRMREERIKYREEMKRLEEIKAQEAEVAAEAAAAAKAAKKMPKNKSKTKK